MFAYTPVAVEHKKLRAVVVQCTLDHMGQQFLSIGTVMLLTVSFFDTKWQAA